MSLNCAYSRWLQSHGGRWGNLDKSVSSAPVERGWAANSLSRHVLGRSTVTTTLAVFSLDCYVYMSRVLEICRVLRRNDTVRLFSLRLRHRARRYDNLPRAIRLSRHQHMLVAVDAPRQGAPTRAMYEKIHANNATDARLFVAPKVT
jgi:hypothetical protein